MKLAIAKKIDDLEADCYSESTTVARSALRRLAMLADAVNLRACEVLAEFFTRAGPLSDAAAAYFWYHIVLSQEGYRVGFDNLDNTGASYLGPVGDFRNEAEVSDLVSELGFEQCRAIDERTRHWLEAHRLSYQA